MARGWNTGDRIGAMIGATHETKTIKWLGFGEYAGEEVPPPEVGGFNVGLPNPKLRLDNGKTCYGCETWWGSEAEMTKKIDLWKANGWTIVTVDIDDARRA